MHRNLQILDKKLSFVGHNDSYLNHLELGGEDYFIDFMSKGYLSGDPTIFDVGANIGFISAIFSLYNPKSQIYAFEPGESNFNYLSQNIESNNLDNVQTFNLALANSNGYQKFNENSAWGYLENEQLDSKSIGAKVRVMTIDQFIFENKVKKVDFIKIDVEGFEKHVLDGMTETLEMFNPKVMFEFNSFCMLAYGKVNPLDFLNQISSKFKYIFRFNRNNKKELLEKMELENFALSALHHNIVHHGSVDDFLVFN